MIYKNMINELSNSRMIKLINEEKLFWYQVNHPNHYKKLESLTYEDLIEGKIEKEFNKNLNFLNTSLSLSETSAIYKLANDFFEKDKIKYSLDSYQLLDRYLTKNPSKKEELKKHVKTYTVQNISLLYDEDPQKLAEYLNTRKVNVYTLTSGMEHLKIAPINTIINDNIYMEVTLVNNMKDLLDLFPRNIAFSWDVVRSILKLDRKLFFKLPLINQADPSHIKYVTNNIIYASGWGDYDQPDPENISLKGIDPAVFNYIKEDKGGVELALEIIKSNPNYIKNENIQKLLNNGKNARSFAQYSKYFTEEQKTLAGIYSPTTVPSVLGDKLEHQSNDVLIAFIKKTDNKKEMMSAFMSLLYSNLKVSKLFDKRVNALIVENLDELFNKGFSFEEEIVTQLTKLVIKNNSKDFKNLKKIEILCDRYSILTYNYLIDEKLTMEEKIGYLKYEESLEK